ncbi:MAG: Aliphatic amidase [Phycisphaerae bacterium]|nr:Aliphatic amidase [Phycisphaerae bacterium]
MKTLCVAAGQIPAYRLEQAAESLRAIEQAILQCTAANPPIDLLVLPECAYPAYLINSAERYRSAAILSNTDFLRQLGDWASQHHLHILCGYVEDTGSALYNSAALVTPNGLVVGKYRKSFLWGADNHYFQAGEQINALDSDLGKIGVAICADARAPEIIARQQMNGAQLLALPTCWVNVAQPPARYENPQPEFLIPCRAREFGLPFVCADKFGQESDKTGYVGRSMIVDAHGRILVEAPPDAETVIWSEIEITPPLQPKPSAAWEQLLQIRSTVRPTPQTLSPVRLVLSNSPIIEPEAMERLAQQEITLLVTLDEPQNLPSPPPFELLWSRHGNRVIDMGFGRVATLRFADLHAFIPARRLALSGVALLVVFDAEDDLRLLRTRAVENRFFIAALGRSVATVVAPNGALLGYSTFEDQEGLVAEVRIAEASNKMVAPGTDIWDQRRITTYL